MRLAAASTDQAEGQAKLAVDQEDLGTAKGSRRLVAGVVSCLNPVEVCRGPPLDVWRNGERRVRTNARPGQHEVVRMCQNVPSRSPAPHVQPHAARPSRTCKQNP